LQNLISNYLKFKIWKILENKEIVKFYYKWKSLTKKIVG